MSGKENWDQELSGLLHEEAGRVGAGEALKSRIDNEIDAVRQKEEWNMKHISVKKIVLGTAAACLLLTGGVFASGRIASYQSSGSSVPTYTSYSDLNKAEKEIGYTVDAVEKFSNGYAFKEIGIQDESAMDEEGNVVSSFKGLSIYYSKGGSPDVAYGASNGPYEEESAAADQSVQAGDVTVAYRQYTYKSVPPDYELTEEDKANLNNPKYMLSYGSSEVKIQNLETVNWRKDGVSYNLLSFDAHLGGDQMLTMAKEIIGQ